MKKFKKTKIFIYGKKSHSAGKNWKEDPLGFSNIHSVAKQQKIEGVKGGKNFPEISLAVPKKIGRGDPLVSPGMVWYAGKQEKPFWFSSQDQIVQFGAIILCRTFKNYFGQLVWIEKKQAGTGPSRRHIQGSKIAKRLPSVKYSLL